MTKNAYLFRKYQTKSKSEIIHIIRNHLIFCDEIGHNDIIGIFSSIRGG